LVAPAAFDRASAISRDVQIPGQHAREKTAERRPSDLTALGLADYNGVCRHSRQKETRTGGEPTLYKNILIPIGGSDLAPKAVERGITFAKEVGAKVTAVRVTEPFAAFALAPSQLE